MKAKNVDAVYRQEDEGYAVYVGEYCAFKTHEVALLLNKNGYRVVRHGTPAEIHKVHAHMMRTCASNPELADFAEDLVVVSGQFDVDVLNRILQGKESARALYTKLEHAASRKAQDVLARVMHG